MVSIAAIYLEMDIIALIARTPLDLLLPSVVISSLILVIGLLPSIQAAYEAA